MRPIGYRSQAMDRALLRRGRQPLALKGLASLADLKSGVAAAMHPPGPCPIVQCAWLSTHSKFIDPADLLNNEPIPSMSLDTVTGTSSDPITHKTDTSPGTASADQPSAAAREQELQLFGRLIDELEKGLQKRDPIDWTRLVDYSRNWRKHVPDDVVPELSATHLRQFHDATDQIIATTLTSSDATSAESSSSPSPSSAYSSVTTQGRLPRPTKLAPHELPLEELDQLPSSERSQSMS
ncbi:hypothetical protein H4R35_006504, partial [Dimargaris xerosporica]